jgi:hypothetical protein
MASYKNLSSDWYIDVDGGTGTVYINGSVDITGNVTTVSELAVDDAFIIVAANNTGTVTDMGIVAQKTVNTYAGLRFDTVASAWQISSSVNQDGTPIAAYANLASGGTGIPGGNVNDIQINNGSGGFTASNNFEFDIANNRVILNGHQVLGNQPKPNNVANSVAIYSNAVGSGGTGLYFTSSAAADELVSKSAAIVFSIIF